MYISLWKKTVALLAASVFLATGCAQLQPVPLRQNGQSIERPDVKPGESVVVTTKSGDTREFKVTAVEDDALRGDDKRGDDQRVAFSEIASLEVRRNDGQFNKTALVVGAVLVGAAVIGAASGGGGGGY